MEVYSASSRMVAAGTRRTMVLLAMRKRTKQLRCKRKRTKQLRCKKTEDQVTGNGYLPAELRHARETSRYLLILAYISYHKEGSYTRVPTGGYGG